MVRTELRLIFASALLVLSIVIAFSAHPASAQNTTPFASFSETGTSELFTFTDNGSSSTFSGTNIPVNFVFTTPNGYGGVDQNIAATLTFTSTVSGPATAGGMSDQQGLTTFNAVFTAVNPIAGKSDLLTITSNAGVLQGTDGTSGASFTASTKQGRNYLPDNVVYSSDFLNFNNTTHDRNYQIGMTSIQDTTPGQEDDGFTIGVDGYLESFESFGSGTFASNPVPPSLSAVPEPDSLQALLLFTAGCTLLLLYRKTRQTTAA